MAKLPENPTEAVAYLISMIGAIGALGTAAFGLVDATKAFRGGVSNVGFPQVKRVLDRFRPALDAALGAAEWPEVLRSHWINGRPRTEQVAIVKGLIRLGLAPNTAPPLAAASRVDPAALEAVAKKLQDGTALVEADLNVLGRLDAAVDALLAAAYERADQAYRNVAQVLAGIFSVVLALVVNYAGALNNPALAIVIGLFAVPLAPIAKDLASSLQAAAAAMRVVRAKP